MNKITELIELLQTNSSASKEMALTRLGDKFFFEETKADYKSVFRKTKKLSSALIELLLLVTTTHKDWEFFFLIVSNHPKIFTYETFGVCTARFRWDLAYNRYADALEMYEKMKKISVPMHHDACAAYDAAINISRFQTCEQLIMDGLAASEENLDWKLIALNYQAQTHHITKTPDETLINNINVLNKKVTQATELLLLGAAKFKLGYWKEAFADLSRSSEIYCQTYDPSLIQAKTLNNLELPTYLASALKAQKTLTQLGVENFLGFGTFLGLHRDGKTIDHDKDADVCVNFGGTEIQFYEMLRNFCNIGRFSIPGIINDKRESHRWNLAVLDNENHTMIDLFFSQDDQERRSYGILTPADPIVWSYPKPALDIHSQLLGGHSVFVPKNAEWYLNLTYGDTWAEPQEAWDSLINSPNLDKSKAKGMAYYSHIRLNTALTENAHGKMLNYLSFFNEHDEFITPSALKSLNLAADRLNVSATNFPNISRPR